MADDFAGVAYSSFRILIQGYQNISYGPEFSEWKMWEDEEGLTDNFLVGGVASDLRGFSTNSTYTVNNVFDGKESTRWRATSNPTPATPSAIQYDLPAPKKAVRMQLMTKSNAAYLPRDIILQGSNNSGATWDDIAAYDVVYDSFPGDRVFLLYRNVTGVAKLQNGEPVNRVGIYDWATGAVRTMQTPDSEGNWGWVPDSLNPVMLVYKSDTPGYRPLADGPIYPARTDLGV